MALFEFELASVEDILPWGEPGDQHLSWFALTDGRFHIAVGEQVLFRYTDEVLSRFGSTERDADYQVADFAREILECAAAGVAPLPPRIERLASNWPLLTELMKPIEGELEADNDLLHEAWGWLGERSPNTSWLVAYPRIQFVRIGDELRIHWDNREQSIDGRRVWTAQHGVHAMPVGAFKDECMDFAQRLLAAMQERIAGIEAGAMRPQVEVSIRSLREQHETWRAEFASYFRDHQPDMPWQEAENALVAIAEAKGLRF